MSIRCRFSVRLAKDIRRLHPGCFALVMATGIISIAAYNLSLGTIAYTLFWSNIVFYGVLWCLTLSRLVFFPKTLLKDFCSYKLGPTFFTIPAGSCVVGSQIILLLESTWGGAVLWGIGFISWAAIMYGFFYVATIASSKPSLKQGLTGAWSLPVVATFSVSILSVLLSVRLPVEEEAIFLLIALAMFLSGIGLYIFIISLMFYRFFFFSFTPRSFTVPYWINMGVEAIATLAGSTLILHAANWSFLVNLLSFLKGVTLTFWALSNWWFPLLVLLGVWRYIVCRIPMLRYDIEYWSMIFPLGMYAACTFQLGRVVGVELFKLVSVFFVTVALEIWALNFIGLCYKIVRRYVLYSATFCN